MGDTNIVYEKFGTETIKREIIAELGSEFWEKLIDGITVPDIEAECKCQCRNMYAFMKRFTSLAPADKVKEILYKVRHGLRREQSAWAREQLLQYRTLDEFLEKHLTDELASFKKMHDEGKDFYGQWITDEVLEFVRQNPSMLSPVRKGNKLYIMAFPNNMEKYLKAKDSKMKRYYACHCPYAKESILAEKTVDKALCNCSLGHVMNFVEALFERPLEGKVISSLLSGDMTCTYEITIPDDIMKSIVISDVR